MDQAGGHPPDKTFKLGDHLSDCEVEHIKMTGHCCDCQVGELKEGPNGGLSVNVYCDNPGCGSRFNVCGTILTERITDASPNANAPVAF